MSEKIFWEAVQMHEAIVALVPELTIFAWADDMNVTYSMGIAPIMIATVLAALAIAIVAFVLSRTRSKGSGGVVLTLLALLIGGPIVVFGMGVALYLTSEVRTHESQLRAQVVAQTLDAHAARRRVRRRFPIVVKSHSRVITIDGSSITIAKVETENVASHEAVESSTDESIKVEASTTDTSAASATADSDEVSKTKASDSESVLVEKLPGDGSVAADSSDSEAESVTTIPDWVNNSQTEVAQCGVGVITSGQYATLAKADETAKQKAAAAVTKYFKSRNRVDQRFAWNATSWNASQSRFLDETIKERFVETVQTNFGDFTAPMYRVHLKMDVDSTTLSKLRGDRNATLINNRLWIVGGAFAFLTILFGTITSYLRLNTSTKGRYRRRLQFAALSVIAAGGLVAGSFILV